MSERSIFLTALEMTNPAERAAYLERACANNAALRKHIEDLIAAEAQLGSFLKEPAVDVEATVAPPALVEQVGTQIGPYKLIQTIGEGGMGVVYMAQQAAPVKRLVALKIIKPGMDTRQVIARFEAERQTLALMDHPNIAKVLDAGATESGRPYFVMELVKGIPLTQYCDAKRLTPRERLELFLPVCQAVQHAHQKGIIHRDLKPSNVLVALYDGQPVPKVIDFGVAKATGGQLTEKTLVTGFGSLVGTLEYMSPEQAELNQLDVDTRSDIYSLGVLLYELLTGTTPFDRQRLRTAAFTEMLRIIREEEPPLPSTRLSTSDSLAAVAASRQLVPARLTRLIRGEIDWIVMKALEKDRNRRYETANNLAQDIRRFLDDEPVAACPPSLVYRASKFTRRYKAPLSVALAFLLLLLAGAAVSSWQAIRAKNAEAAAIASAQQARDAAEAAKIAKDSEAKQRQAAEANEQAALEERNNALAARGELRETIYAIDMAQVQAAGDSRQFARVAQLLDLHRPGPGQSDLRGFEWHYWKRRLQRGRLRAVEIPQLATTSPGVGNTRIFSRNGARLAAIIDQPHDSPSPPGFGLLSIFDCLTGRELVAPFDPFPGQRQPEVRRARLMTMSDDGTRLAAALGRYLGRFDAAEQGNRLSIRDGDTGAEIRSIEVPLHVSDIALTADGSRIAVEYAELAQSEDPRRRPTSGLAGVKVWDTSTGELIQTLPMLPWSERYNQILWSPDGTRLLRQSVTMDFIDAKQTFHELFQVVDVASGEELWDRKFPPHATARRAWTWSPDGELVVIFELAEPGIAAKSNAQVWDSYAGKVLAILDREAPSAAGRDATIDFSPDSSRLAVATTANEIYLWDLPDLKIASAAEPLHIPVPHLTLQTAASEICAIAFTANGRELVSSDTGPSIVTWDATRREEARVGPDGLEGYVSAEISADATKVAFSSGGTKNPFSSIWDLATNREVFRSKTVGSGLARPGFSPDGRRVALVQLPDTPDGISHIRIYDTQSGEELSAIPVEQTGPSFDMYAAGPVFRPDGGQMAAWVRPTQSSPQGNRQPARLMAWDVATGKPVFSVTVNSINSMIAGWLEYSPDGESLVLGTTGQPDSAALFYDAATGELQRSIPMPGSPTKRAGVFIDVRHQIYANFDGPDALFSDLATGQERLRLRGFADISESAFTPDGSRLAVAKEPPFGGGESELSLWSFKSGRQLLSLKCQGYVERLAFSPDGNRLIAVCQPSGATTIKPIQIWDATPLPDEDSESNP